MLSTRYKKGSAMLTQRSAMLTLLSAVVWLSASLPTTAQVAFNKTQIFDTAQSAEVLGFTNNTPLDFFYAKRDSTSLFLTFGSRDEVYRYTNYQERWIDLSSLNLIYDTPNPPSGPSIRALSDGKALVVPGRGNNTSIEYVYISDGTNAHSIVANTDWGGLDSRTVHLASTSFVEGNLYATVTTNSNYNAFYLVEKRGNDVLTRLNSAPLIDPRFDFVIDSIQEILPITYGIAFLSSGTNGVSLYKYHDGEVAPLFDSGSSLFGDRNIYIRELIQTSVIPQDGFLFRYQNPTLATEGIGQYEDNVFIKILEKGQSLPNNGGIIHSIVSASLDNNDILLQVVLDNGTSFPDETALVYYREGKFQVIDRYFSGGTFSMPFRGNSLMDNSFVFTEYYANESGGYGGYRVSLYSAVPEPGIFALFASFGVMGLMYTRRRNKTNHHVGHLP